MNSFRKLASKGLEKGDVFRLTRTFSKEETLEFGDMTLDYNPVHYDERWRKNKGFKGLICHGLLVGSMVCEFGGQVGWLATGMNFKFIKPVYFQDTIECIIKLTELDKTGRASAEASFINQEGQKVCFAKLTGRLPIDKDKTLLEEMIKQGDPSNKLSDKNYT